jgi:hypothetical protein
MLTSHAIQQLVGEFINVGSREWLKLIILQEVINTHSQELRDKTDVVAMIEPIEEVDAITTGYQKRVEQS